MICNEKFVGERHNEETDECETIEWSKTMSHVTYL